MYLYVMYICRNIILFEIRLYIGLKIFLVTEISIQIIFSVIRQLKIIKI